jgi:hypothetical protein
VEPGQAAGRPLVDGELQGGLVLRPGWAAQCASPSSGRKAAPAMLSVPYGGDQGVGRPQARSAPPDRGPQDPRIDPQARPTPGAGQRPRLGRHHQPAGRPLVRLLHRRGRTTSRPATERRPWSAWTPASAIWRPSPPKQRSPTRERWNAPCGSSADSTSSSPAASPARTAGRSPDGSWPEPCPTPGW